MDNSDLVGKLADSPYIFHEPGEDPWFSIPVEMELDGHHITILVVANRGDDLEVGYIGEDGVCHRTVKTDEDGAVRLMQEAL